MIGTEIAPPMPCGTSHTTKTQFVRTTSGEIEMSNPPPMIEGALASAASVIGAAIASWSVTLKFPSLWMIVAASSPANSSNEKA